jgi:hypothetical protein
LQSVRKSPSGARPLGLRPAEAVAPVTSYS